MIIGILKLVVYLDNSSSLKEKRMALESLKKRLRNEFNISILEIADADKWQKSTMVVVNAVKDKKNANMILSNIVNYINNDNQLQLLDYETEFI